MLGTANTETLEILCLANSRKMQGRCIAGLRTDGGGGENGGGGWVRPIAAGADSTLRPADCLLPDGTEPRPLDVISVGIAGAKTEPHQPENVRISRAPWGLVSRPGPGCISDPTRALLTAHLVKGPLLLGNFGDKRDYAGLRQTPAAASLVLVVPESLIWVIGTSHRGHRRTTAEFRLTHTPYCLSVTDPAWTQRLAHLPLGRHPKEAAGVSAGATLLFTISLSEPLEWNNHCYKLVAGVIVLPPLEEKR